MDLLQYNVAHENKYSLLLKSAVQLRIKNCGAYYVVEGRIFVTGMV